MAKSNFKYSAPLAGLKAQGQISNTVGKNTFNIKTSRNKICMLQLGFGNMVSANRIIAIVNANTAPVRRLKNEAKKMQKLIDATSGRKTRSVIIVDSDHIILSAAQSETLVQRLSNQDKMWEQG